VSAPAGATLAVIVALGSVLVEAAAGESRPVELAPTAPVPVAASPVAPSPAGGPAVPATLPDRTDLAEANLPAVTIDYEVFRDGVGFAVGRSEHRVERPAPDRYRIATAWETSGLAAVLKRVRVHHVSEGAIVDGRLRPQRYRTWREDKQKEAQAEFDWAALQLRQAAGIETLPPGTIDPVVVFYQFGLASAPSLPAALRLANGRRIKTLQVASLGNEALHLPGGESVATRRLRATEDDGEVTELWLAERYAGYPLQITHTDRDGTRYRQIATSIRMEPHALAQPPR
jgi:hypothetical protein